MKLKDTNVSVKVSGVIILLLIFGIISYSLIVGFNNEKYKDSYKLGVSEKNLFYSQRIDDLTKITLSSNPETAQKAKQDLVKCVSSFFGNLHLLKDGGSVQENGKIFEIEPADNITVAKISRIETILQNLNDNIQIIIKENTDINSSHERISFSDSVSNEKNVAYQASVNKKLANAYSEIESVFLTNTLSDAAKELVDNYNSKSVEKQASLYKLLFFIGLFNLIVLIFSYWLFKNYIIKPLKKLKDVAHLISEGDFTHKCIVTTKDDIGEIAQSINELIENSTKASTFADSIGQGNLDIEFNARSEKDVLGHSLLVMRKNLVELSHEETKRNWSTKGLAMFGEILRSNTSDIIELSNSIISNLVKYLNANQGSIFIINDEKPADTFLELKASYAWGKKKYLKMRVDLGEGLLGQTWQEGETIFLTDIPDKFITITSGLGEANPNCIVIVPLKINGQIYGVIEFASFTVFDKHQIEFLEKLGESIASTISTTKINEKTKKLLIQSQQQTEEMRAQEEELRQNMEEMQATQEEMERILAESKKQQSELSARMAQVDLACIVSESDLKGNITFVNNKFCEVSKYSREELMGKPHSIVRHPDMPKEAFKQMWATIGSGKIFRAEVKNMAKDGTPYWVDAIIAPVLGENGKPVKYIGIRYDITESKKMQLQLQEQMQHMLSQEEELRQNIEEMNATQEELQRVLTDSKQKQAELNTRMAQVDAACIVSETDLKGNITYVNDKFCEVAKYTREELIGKPHNIVRHPDMPKEAFKQMWATIGSGKIFRAEVKNKAKDGTPYWVDAIIAPVLGENGKPVKYIGIRYDITESKKLQLALEEQMKLMRIKEEELRQNVEEMRAIQEDLEGKNREKAAN